MVQSLDQKNDPTVTAPPQYTESQNPAMELDDEDDTSSESSFSEIDGPARSVASPPPDSREATPNPNPTMPSCNHLEISKDHQPIHGNWRIDTALVIPAMMLSPLEDGEQRPNLLLRNQAGPIDAAVELVRGEAEGRAFLKLANEYGPVTLRLTNPLKQKAFVHVTSDAGPVRLCIPRSFRGPVTIKESNGTSDNFSPDLSANCTTFYQRNEETKAFIGELAGSGFGDEGITWAGDELYAESQHAGVKICYVDEVPDGRSRGRRNRGPGHHFGFGWYPTPPTPPVPPTLPYHGFPPAMLRVPPIPPLPPMPGLGPFATASASARRRHYQDASRHYQDASRHHQELLAQLMDGGRGGRGGGRGGFFGFGFGGRGGHGHGHWHHHHDHGHNHDHEHDHDHDHEGDEHVHDQERAARHEERAARREERRRHRHHDREHDRRRGQTSTTEAVAP